MGAPGRGSLFPMTPPSWLEDVTAVAERGRGSTGSQGVASLAATCDRLIARRGEASGLALATEVARTLERLSNPETAEFLEVLAGSLSPPPHPVAAAVARWRSEPTDEAVMALAIATEAPR